MAGRIVAALLEHNFDVSKIESLAEQEDQCSPVTSVVLNGVNLTFQLFMRAKDKRKGRHEGHIGLYIQYMDGPTDVVSIGYVLLLLPARGPLQAPVVLVGEAEHEFTSKYKKLHCGWGSVDDLPNTLEQLRRSGYVDHNSVLHAFAVLFVPESAFEDPSNKCPVSLAQNPFIHHLYGDIGTPVATNSPFSNRVELISKDGQRFWVHKDVLAFASDAFKQMFDPDKPEAARFKYLRDGRMTLENVSGGALKEMLNFIYLKHTTPDFNQFAMELVPVAEMYELNGLSVLCLQTLIVQAKNEKNIEQMLRFLDLSVLHKLVKLETVCICSLKKVVLAQNENLDRELILKVTKCAHDQGYDQLQVVCEQKLKQYVNGCENLTVSIIHELGAEAEKYGLNDVLVACGEWLGRNWEMANNSGQLNGVMEDKTGGLFTRLMAFAAKK